MGKDKRKRKYRKEKYAGSKKARLEFAGDLSCGNHQGILITCSTKDAGSACREAYNLLNNYVAELKDKKVEEDKDDSDDIASMLKQDCEELTDRSFVQLKIGSKLQLNTLFIKIKQESKAVQNIDDSLLHPSHMIQHILNKCKESQTSICRHICRIIPVERTCRANLSSISEAITPLIKQEFEDKDNISYSIVYKARFNDALFASEILETVGAMVKSVNPFATVDAASPHIAILVNVIMNTCCLSLVKEWMELSKYNIQQVATKAKGQQPANELTT